MQPTVAVMPPQTVALRRSKSELEAHARTLLAELERVLQADSVVSWVPLDPSERPGSRQGTPVVVRRHNGTSLD